MQAAQQQEHQWLEQLVGKWECESECIMGPGQAPMKSTGKENVRSIGGVWVQCEGQIDVPGAAPMVTQMTLGYDPVKKRYTGTFIGSMMTHLWLYDGEIDPQTKVLVLDAEGPSFIDPSKTARYKDSVEIVDADQRTLKSSYQGPDGQWHHFMTATYRRVA